MFVIGRQPSKQGPRIQRVVSLSKDSNLPGLSSQASVGRNSQFFNLTAEDRKTLGGIEYRALKVLLRIVIGKNPKTTVVKQQVVVDPGNRVSRWASSTWYNLPGPLDPPCGPQVQELS